MEHIPKPVQYLGKIMIPLATLGASLTGLVANQAHADQAGPTLTETMAEPVGPNAALDVDITGEVAGTKPGDYTFLNLTAVNADKPNFATLQSSDATTRTDISILNVEDASARPNAAGARIGADGKVKVVNGPFGSVDIIADHMATLDGSVVDSASKRLFDSRDRGYKVDALEEICVPTSGDDGDGAILNITITEATGPGFVVAYPGDAGIPGASTQNYNKNIADGNSTVVKVGVNDNKEVCVRNMVDQQAHLIIDDMGSISSDAFIPTESGEPERIVDTRIGFGGNMLSPGGKIQMSYGNPGDIVMLNVVPLNASNPGFATVYTSGQTTPKTSSVNFYPGSVMPNMTFPRSGADGKITLENTLSNTDYVVDVLGTLKQEYVKNASSLRLNDTREVDLSKPGLTEIPYNPNTAMGPNANVDLIQTHNNVSYGPSNTHNFDIYESRNNKENNGTLVWFFGGGWEGGDNSLTNGNNKIAKHVAAQYGYKLVAVDYPLTSEAPYPAQYQAGVATMKYLYAHADELGINRANIIMGGYSAGADIATMAGLGHDNPVYQPTWMTPAEISAPARPTKILAFAPPVDKSMGLEQVSTGHPNAGLTVGALNKLVGLSPTAPPAYSQYAQLAAVTQASTNDPPVYITFSPTDDVIPFASQRPAIQALAGQIAVVLNIGGPSNHVAGYDTNVARLIEFIQL